MSQAVEFMNQDALLSLIGRIYDAGSGPAHWPAALQDIADAFGAGDASLSAVSPHAVPCLVAPRRSPLAQNTKSPRSRCL